MEMLYPKKITGFTLLELVAVILIVSILAVMVSMQWPSTKLNLSAQAEQLAADLRYTQTLSMTQAVRHCLVLTGSTYQIISSATSTPISFSTSKTTVTLGSGISFGTFIPAGLAMLVFDGTGAPYSSTSTTCNTTNATGAIALTAAANIPIVASGQTKTLVISPETGRIIIQ